MKKAKPARRVQMLEEYDFSKGVRGKYAKRYAKGTNVVVLDPDVAKVFPSSEAVNDALRTLAEIAKKKNDGVHERPLGQFIELGRKVTIWGKIIRIIIQASIAPQKGITPLNMVFIGMSRATPWSTKTLTPTGGVIKLISMVKVMMIPNQTGSNPS